jgi:hypothetical protein
VLKERSPLAPDLRGLESGVQEPSCKEYTVRAKARDLGSPQALHDAAGPKSNSF